MGPQVQILQGLQDRSLETKKAAEGLPRLHQHLLLIDNIHEEALVVKENYGFFRDRVSFRRPGP